MRPYTDILPYIIIPLKQFDTFRSRDIAIYPFLTRRHKITHFIKIMPPKKFTRTQLRTADIHDSDDILQRAASMAVRATPAVIPEAEIDVDNDLHDYLRAQGHHDCPIDNDIGDLRSQISNNDRLEVATFNRVMLEILLDDHPQ